MLHCVEDMQIKTDHFNLFKEATNKMNRPEHEVNTNAIALMIELTIIGRRDNLCFSLSSLFCSLILIT